MNTTRKALFVATSNGQLGDTGKPTGFHWEELATPYYILEEHGCAVEFASPNGGRPPHDPGSLKDNQEERPESVRRFLSDQEAMRKLETSRALEEVSMDDYDVIYIPGGHGTMWDLPGNDALAGLLKQADSQGKIIGSVCHGPAAFVGATDADGNPFVKGRQVNCFTDEEERAVGLDDVVPFLLESKLRELGADFTHAGKFEACVAVDGNLVTGQNPPSCAGVAEKIVALLESGAERRAAG